MFNPIQAAEEIKSSYIDYIATSFDIADETYASELRTALKQEGMVAKGPYLDIGGAYQAGHTLHELMKTGSASPLFEQLEPVTESERELKLDRPLYLHQEVAMQKAMQGQSLVVTTGTGSGKTESFLLPVLQHILTEMEKGELDAGVRAIIIYPMNALANDQIKRMRALLKNCSRIRFGIYNGNTPHERSKALGEYRKTHRDAEGGPIEPLPNELISREEMQQEPPHILITNYSMLEYMMLRPKDDKVFSGAKLKYIVLDEAHIYKGATGMETSMLMRRLRARISEPGKVQYILTSATLGGPDANQEIVSFAKKLTGVSFSESGIIRAVERQPKMLDDRDVDPALFTELNHASADRVGEILKLQGLDFAPEGSAEEKLYSLCLRLKLFAVLRRACVIPLTVTQLYREMSGIEPDMTREQLVDFIAVCARAELDGANLIKPRYHFFVRALEGAYITLNAPHRLFLQRQSILEQGGQRQAVFEAAICDDCGRLAVAGKTEDGMLRQFARQGKEDDTEYYLIRQSSDGELFEEEETEEGDGQRDYVVCPVCGAISTEADLRYECPCEHEKENYVKIRLADHTKSGQTKCPACGFGSFRRFYLGSEAATAVLGTELFEQLPTEEITEVVEQRPSSGLFARAVKKKVLRREHTRQFLCFSDSRSEAAFFASYMERSYQEFLRRRGIWHTAEKLRDRGESRVSVLDFVNELSRYYEENRCFAPWDSTLRTGGSLASASRQNAWVAILNEMFNARRSTSLTSLGLLAFAYQRNEGLSDALVQTFQ
ncbi:MAG: DEAD/DEAH box helicase, partial [Oscillospiraceae bacterium]|nr:DEAD/DEAH box helicase [Oscillospiraceae bacterium]